MQQQKDVVISKNDILQFIKTYHPTVAVSYGGHNHTFYITGKDAEKAELAVLKKFPMGVLGWKTVSQLTVPALTVKTYYFTATGEFFHHKAVNNIVFECQARDNRNAKRKFGNYISSLTAQKNAELRAAKTM